MTVLILRIIEKILIIYFAGYFFIDIALYVYSIFVFRRKRNGLTATLDYSDHFVSIIVPAYNEDVSIVHCTRMLLELDYPNYEIIIVNDGSKDHTLDTLYNNFDFRQIDKDITPELLTKPIKKISRTESKKLILIDKENGGKADSINAGINFSNGNYICTIDADSILDAMALKEVVKPGIPVAGLTTSVMTTQSTVEKKSWFCWICRGCPTWRGLVTQLLIRSAA